MTLVIYGASDDLIEVEGEISAEFRYTDSGDEHVLVVGANGSLVKVTPKLDQWWSASAQILNPGPRGQEVTVVTIPRPGSEPGGDMAIQVNCIASHVFKVVDY